MKDQTIVGVYENASAAEHAREEMVNAGIAKARISLSMSLTDDGIAAEAPGQSYENQQEGAPPQREHALAELNEAIRVGACIVSVHAGAGGDAPRVRELMRRTGARALVSRNA